MKEIEVFYLRSCPYCRSAQKAVEELREENPAYHGIGIRWIEESREPQIAQQRDYYYVPTIFWQGEKLYEARPTHSYAVIRDNFKKAFDLVLKG